MIYEITYEHYYYTNNSFKLRECTELRGDKITLKKNGTSRRKTTGTNLGKIRVDFDILSEFYGTDVTGMGHDKVIEFLYEIKDKIMLKDFISKLD